MLSLTSHLKAQNIRPIFPLLTGLLLAMFSVHFYTNTQNQLMPDFNPEDYEKAWKTVDSLDQKGLPKSALQHVEAILARAKKDENSPQLVKAIIYRGKYQVHLEEAGLQRAIEQVAAETETAIFPAKPVLQSVLADLYQQYVQQNRWQLRDRTEMTGSEPSEDLSTWTIGQFMQRSNELYLASVQGQMTKKIDLDRFDIILRKGKFTDKLRPTLYDFLAFRAIRHFSQSNNMLTEPAYKFYLRQPEAFANAKAFSSFEFDSEDESSMLLQAVRLYQEVIAAHLDDPDPVALIDADLHRLQFMHQQSVLSEKDDWYRKALQQLVEKYANHPATAEVQYALANSWYQSGQNYQPNPEEVKRWDWKKAHEICTNTIKKFPDAIGADQCRQLINTLERKSVELQIEQVNQPDQPILAGLKYRNLEKVWVRVVAMSEAERQKLEDESRQDLVKWLAKRPTSLIKTLSLPVEGDYRNHLTEFDIKTLPFGNYAMLVSDNDDFKYEGGAVAYAFFHVSDLAYWTRTNTNTAPELFVTNRTTGEPLKGVTAELYTRNYNSLTRRYNYKKTDTRVSDKNGKIILPLEKRETFRVKLTNGADVLFLDDYLNHYRYDRVGPSQKHTHFFLDRAIYRPGQTVYFKAYVLEKPPYGEPVLQTGQPLEITLYDANRQPVTTKKFTTNEYGTIHGSFEAPKTGLRGQMSLSSSTGNSSHYFRVEEYKRPKFEVEFSPVAGSFRLGDSVEVEGKALAFAGNNVDGAQVVYRVVRQVRFPYRPYWWGWYNPFQRDDMEIANGIARTDENGIFKIKFDMQPDESVPADQKPVFTYKIIADVTDISGETQSGATSVAAGYVALELGIDLPEKINQSKSFPLNISTKNLAGTPEPAVVNVTVTRLETPETIYKNRLWQQPDVWLLSEKDFKQKFPDYPYKDENEVRNWAVDKVVFEEKIDTRLKRLWQLPVQDWQPGQYKVTLAAKDAYGTDVKVEQFVELYELEKKSVATNDAITIYQSDEPQTPGNTYEVCLVTPLKEQWVLVEKEWRDKIVQQDWKKIKNKTVLEFPITEKERGGFYYRISWVHNGRTFNETNRVAVPWSNKELKVEMATFRDKLLPGQPEEWQIKISGPQGEKMAAEMVATMYDASLDQFVGHDWRFSPYPVTSYASQGMQTHGFNASRSILYAQKWQDRTDNIRYKQYPSLNWFGFSPYGNYFTDGFVTGMAQKRSRAMHSPAPRQFDTITTFDSETYEEEVTVVRSEMTAAPAAKGKPEADEKAEDTAPKGDFSGVGVRTNLNETVFFMPDLATDAEGNVVIKFTMNEALTKWKFLGLATTKDLKIGTITKEVVTQKDLMVQPNAPRFMREGDQIVYSAKVSNLSEKDLEGVAKLELFDALTMQPVNDQLGLSEMEIPFSVKAGQSAPLAWKLNIPASIAALTHRVLVKTDDFSDGEESTLPVLTNRMMVTETMPLAVRGNTTKDFVLKGFNQNSSSLTPHRYTLEFTSNPAWYAVQALPYLMEYPHQCTEQIFSRYYANSLASSVANSHPKIQDIFEKWKNTDTDALASNLSKNQELKAVLLEETPWVLAAQSEEKQKQNIGLLFDLNRMANEQIAAWEKITERQLSNGGFAWFPGGRDSWYITQHLVEGMGHLRKLGVLQVDAEDATFGVLQRAVGYIDERMTEHYEELAKRVKDGHTKFEDDHLSNLVIHYLYARSFFPEFELDKKSKKAHDYYVSQAELHWLGKGVYQEGMIGLALNRLKRKSTAPADITKSLKERALQNEELGMYWNETRGFYWYQLPIETQALMVEYFGEVAQDAEAVEELKIWLLKNKQTNHWKTTKATASVVYALLMSGDNWLLSDEAIEVDLHNRTANRKVKDAQEQAEAGTGYFKTAWEGKEIDEKMGKISVNNPNNHPAWGAVYWQYFEDLDKIKTFKETPLTIDKQLFKKINTDKGPQLEKISDGEELAVGELLTVRIEIRVDRAMEYVHLKDMRASGFEPVNVLSQYKWQGSLGYYESTGDAATHFFISYLPKGTHVFEYPLRVSHRGDFSNGITSLQCMYAPEFSSHSEGIRVRVE